MEHYVWIANVRDKTSKHFDIIWDVQEAHNKFPDFFRMGTFIDSTHMKL